MAVIYKCDRCGEEMKARSHHAAELLWSRHECAGLPKLSDIPLDLLREMAYGRMTEAEAFAAMEQRK
jgi:hypothetical protein